MSGETYTMTRWTSMRPLSPIEVDTIRVALALLQQTSAGSLHLFEARIQTHVQAIASDHAIDQLLTELEGAEVDVRRAAS
jgi:hypothetical protein